MCIPRLQIIGSEACTKNKFNQTIFRYFGKYVKERNIFTHILLFIQGWGVSNNLLNRHKFRHPTLSIEKLIYETAWDNHFFFPIFDFPLAAWEKILDTAF